MGNRITEIIAICIACAGILNSPSCASSEDALVDLATGRHALEQEVGSVKPGDDFVASLDISFCSQGVQCASGHCHPEYHFCVQCIRDSDCAQQDTCDAGECVASGIVCIPDTCWCMSQIAACCNSAGTAAKSFEDCDDGNACTLEGCFEGSCTEPVPVACKDDDNSCTVSGCSPETGQCEVQPVTTGTTCDDSDSCTDGDQCIAGDCLGGDFVCECSQDSDCLQYQNMDNKCVGTLACIQGHCLTDQSTIVVCPESNDPCQETRCHPLTGKCVSLPANDGGPCDDSDPCMTKDHCKGGSCVSNWDKCNDGNPCTVDYCNGGTGECTHDGVPGLACDDANACTFNDVCTSFGEKTFCTGEKVVPALSKDPCVKFVCFPAIGVVEVFAFGPCDDNNACSLNDYCHKGVCSPGTPAVCDDQNPSTIDSCDPQLGCLQD
jgi:hypothetical protein